MLYECLSHSRRRSILRCLRDTEKPLALADLAADVAHLEMEAPKSEVDPEEVKKIHLTLYHNHVPKLEEFGLVQYDPRNETVNLSESFDAVGFTDSSELFPTEA
ncbi:DUF7344 domain-containing protein [Halomicrobium zhouii]|uniref:DUF7344 domain-containing protein n=1 Tax=Halomicrobium zhouii TaxID=767519 RepID=UPI001160D8A6|nr:hypothetical protein [Halomicrobium zhouii]